MKLISCDRCGVVLDQDKVNWPDIIDHDTQEVYTHQAEWIGEDWVAVIDCPTNCGNKIPKEE